jgi:hypothetical protein
MKAGAINVKAGGLKITESSKHITPDDPYVDTNPKRWRGRDNAFPC